MTREELQGVPVYRFGSPALQALHAAARRPPVHLGERYGMPVVRQEYGFSHHMHRYVVDHGGFYTLQTILEGQVVPASRDIPADLIDWSAWAE